MFLIGSEWSREESAQPCNNSTEIPMKEGIDREMRNALAAFNGKTFSLTVIYCTWSKYNSEITVTARDFQMPYEILY